MANVNLVQNGRAYVGKFDLTTNIRSQTLDYGAEPLDKTVLSDDTRKRTGGLKTIGYGYSGFWETSTDATKSIDKALFDNIGLSNVPITACANKSSAGSDAYLFRALQGSYAPGGSVGELMQFTVQAEGDDDLVRGAMLFNSTAVTEGLFAAANYIQLGGSTARELRAALHVFEAGTTNPSTANITVTIYSANNSTGGGQNARIVFNLTTGSTAEWGTYAGGSTQDYYGATFSMAGSSAGATFSLAVSAGLSTN